MEIKATLKGLGLLIFSLIVGFVVHIIFLAIFGVTHESISRGSVLAGFIGGIVATILFLSAHWPDKK